MLTDNKFLRVLDSVVLTPTITPVIIALDKYFEAAKLQALVTSGLRNPTDQLRIIRNYLTSKGLASKYPEALTGAVDSTLVLAGKTRYTWQAGWSALLNAGIIINPPRRAECLMDYTRAGVLIPKGRIINGSPHFTGKAFDIGGQANGIADEQAVIAKALADKLPGLLDYLPERENNCTHIDTVDIK